MRVIGHGFFAIGFLGSGVIWIATTVYFFSNDDNFLGLVSLLIPPSEIILPWVVSTQFGIGSLLSLACILFGGLCHAISEEKETEWH